MHLKSILLDRYRLFRNFYEIEIAPMTLLIGKNGSGKSVVSRLPVLLAAGLSESPEGPINLLAGGIEHADSYQDLVFNRGSVPLTLGAKIADDTRSISFATTLRYVHETRSLCVERFVLDDSSTLRVSILLEDVEGLGRERNSFSIQRGDEPPATADLTFNGLFPTLIDFPEPLASTIGECLALFRQAVGQPSYLGPFREEPRRSGRMPSQVIRTLGPRGERALDILADDRLRRGGTLTEQVSTWFARSMNQTLDIDLASDTPQIHMVDNSSGTQVSLADTGAGFAQVLPIVVQHFLYRNKRIDSKLLIVEQPELHLHPAAHGPVADLICESSSSGSDWEPAICLTETHSEQFISRIRRRIAEGYPHQAVRMLSLGHLDGAHSTEPALPLKQIVFDNAGDPDAWPAGVFEEALNDLTAMRQASRAQP